MGIQKAESVAPGSNWLALQKSLPARGNKKSTRRQVHVSTGATQPSSAFPRGTIDSASLSHMPKIIMGDNDLEDLTQEAKQLRKMVLGLGTAAEELTGEPGRYLALDCEMVGVGEDGKESSLARASVVDYHGRVVLDEFVQQRERVTDYRTQHSGVRPEDMIKAKPFRDIQARVAELLAPPDRILVGHALSNDLAALLLTNPASRTRDTQLYAAKKPAPHAVKPGGKGKQNGDGPDVAHAAPTLWEKYRNPRIALKKLAKEELGVEIQTGEHSSVTDARAAMAIYRLHKRAWDASLPAAHTRAPATTSRHVPDEGDDHEDSGTESLGRRKRKRRSSDRDSFPGGGRRGVSSGLSTIIRGTHTTGGQKTKDMPPRKEKWWQRLGEAGPSGSKGQLRLD